LNYTRPVFHLELREGSPYTVTFVVEDDLGLPKDLTGYSARFQARTAMNGNFDGYATPYKVMDLSQTLNWCGSGVILGGVEGTVTLVIDAFQTDELGWNRGVYDLFLIPPDNNGSISRPELFMQGFVSIISSVTKVLDMSCPSDDEPDEERYQPDFTQVDPCPPPRKTEDGQYRHLEPDTEI